MVTVVCLNAHNYLGRGDEYVAKLRSMVRRNLTVPYDFVCLTEADFAGGEGWWLKLDILRMFDGFTLYLDLDVVITSNIDHLIEIARADTTKLWARNDFSYPVSANSRIVGDGYAGPLMENGREATINSSVMLWHGRYDVPRLEGVHGDQGCVTAALWPDRIGLLPDDSVRSYRYHHGQLAPIVVFHGQPKPHEVNDAWVRDHWR